MQKAFTADWKDWQFSPGDDALPNLPSWVDAGNARVVSDALRIIDSSRTDHLRSGLLIPFS